MATGLSAPRFTRLYKEAWIEVQRLSAYASAVLVPLLFVMSLILFTQGDDDKTDAIIQVEFMDENIPLELTQPAPVDEQLPSESMDVGVSSISFPVQSAVQDVGDVAPTPSPAMLSQQAGLVRTGIIIPGLGRAGAAGPGFGSTNGIKGDLTGVLYDLKRDGKGDARVPNYWEDVRRMVGGRLSERAVRDFYRVPKSVYLSHLFVPYTQAETGPASFGVGGLMEPKAWVAHYRGLIQPPGNGSYRFVGDFDDLLIVMIDGRVVLEVTWDNPGNVGGVTGWKPKENVGPHRCFTSRNFVYGDWVELRNTETRRIDILVGERPGGMIGGVLLVQREGATYEKEANGRPVLPVFAVSLLSPQERERIANFKGLAFDRNIVMMGVTGDGASRKTALVDENDIPVLSGNL
jgi:hypothetical protein